MKRIQGLYLAIVLTFVFVLAGFPVQAEEKIGFFNMDQVMRESIEGKKAIDAFMKMADKSKSAIQEKEAELQKLKDELTKQGSLMKADVLKDKEMTYQKKVRDYQILVKDSNEELQGKQQEIAKEFYPEILKIIKSIGEKEKYTMIIDISTFPVAHWNKASDLTPRVLDEFNKNFKPVKK